MAKSPRLRFAGKKRGRWVLWVCFVFFLALLAVGYALFHRESFEGWKTFLQQIGMGTPATSLARGSIRDRRLVLLAETGEKIALFIQVREVVSLQKTISTLADLLSLNRQELEAALTSGKRRVLVARDIGEKKALALKKENLPGVHLQVEQGRNYPAGDLVSHLLGYVVDDIGFGGAEEFYDQIVLQQGLIAPISASGTSETWDLQLTIDLRIQEILASLVEAISKTIGNNRVAACLIESGTGMVVGYYQHPSFDPNDIKSFRKENTQDLFLTPLILPDRFRSFLRDAISLAGHGEGAKRTRIPWSLRQDERDLGQQIRMWEKLGLNSQSGWFPGEPQSFSTGQTVLRAGPPEPYGLSLVPVQTSSLSLLYALSVLVNGQGPIRPVIAQRLAFGNRWRETGRLLTYDPQWLGDTGEEYDSEIMKLFEAVSKRGNNDVRYFQDRVVVSEKIGQSSRFHRNDLMYAHIPVEQHDLNLLVTVQSDSEYPLKTGEAGQGQLQKRVEERIKDIQQQQILANFLGDDVEPGKVSRAGGDIPGSMGGTDPVGIPVPGKVVPVIMPNVVGTSLRMSLRSLQSLKCRIRIEGTGKVVSQEPAAGTVLKAKTECRLILQKEEDITLDALRKKKTP